MPHMSIGFLPRTGSELGPCVESCDHMDCIYGREMANTPCGLCGEPIGEETGFYRDGELDLVHSDCLHAKPRIPST